MDTTTCVCLLGRPRQSSSRIQVKARHNLVVLLAQEMIHLAVLYPVVPGGPRHPYLLDRTLDGHALIDDEVDELNRSVLTLNISRCHVHALGHEKKARSPVLIPKIPTQLPFCVNLSSG